MPESDRKTHWEAVYSTKAENELSWFQSEPRLSLEWIRQVLPPEGGRIIDVGGGSSVLVDWLLDLACETIAVLDISETALQRARTRLGARAEHVDWIVADVTAVQDLGTFDVWHDRAVFHFLTDAEDRRRYVELARRTVPPGGHVIVATFADEGPRRCSGLDVRRYHAASLSAEFEGFALTHEQRETHTTPWGSSQPFVYGVFRRR